MPSLICSRCSQKNDESAVRCASCGEPFDATGARNIAKDPRRLIGRIINGKYEVLEVLGEGGMGVVYKVRHLILQNKNIFALKVLHPKFSSQSNFQARFLREVEIAMDLTHENVVQIRDFGVTEQNLLFYTMDFFPGITLRSLIEESGALRSGRATAIARSVLLALAEAHKLGIVHRDLKPDNILIEPAPEGDDRVRILDFGIAKLLCEDSEEDRGLTRGAVIGTPKYMSPEQASGEKIDGRADLYSLGVILYEMLLGAPPFKGETARQILICHLTVEPQPFREVRSDLKIPADLEDIVLRLLAKERKQRPATAEEVLALLAGDERATAVAKVRLPLRMPRKRLVAGAALVVLAVAALEHFVPWRRLISISSHAEAEGAARAPAAPPGQAPPPPRESPRSNAPARKLRCAVCGAQYAQGEKVGDMCHGEPLLEM